MHEASFVFNPLTRRVPHASPRKAAAAPSGSREKGKSREPAASSPAPTAVRHEAPASAEAEESELLPLGLASKEVQEALILEDLLFVLMVSVPRVRCSENSQTDGAGIRRGSKARTSRMRRHMPLMIRLRG